MTEEVVMERTVASQDEFDQAVADGVRQIYIDSPRGVWIRVEAWDSASVVARGSSSVVARGSASVVAWDSSSVEARGSASVVARDSASVVARDSASVVAWDSSSVEARGRSSVEARDSASVVAWDSASVVAWDSSSVEARGASSIHTYGAKVVASARCAVFVHRAGAVVDGGVVIDVIDPDTDPADWCDWNGVEVDGGRAIVYKAVDDDWTTPRGFIYKPGRMVTAPDWRDDDTCGGGLHFGPTPRHARQYFTGASRFVRVSIPLDAARPIPGGAAKIKARECLVLGEVTIDRKPVVEAGSPC